MTVAARPGLPPVEDLTARVGTANVKGGLSRHGNGAGHGLGNSVDRMVLAGRRAHDVYGATVLGTQETSRLQVEEGNSRLLWWNVHEGTPNVVRGDAAVGNAVWWRRDVWAGHGSGEVVVHVGHVVSRYVIPEDLHFPWQILEHRTTGARVRVGSFHFPAGRTRSAQAAKRVCASGVAAAFAGNAVPTVWVGDRNTTKVLTDLSHVSHVVDYVGSSELLVTDPVVDKVSKGTVSDHAAVSGAVHIPVPVPVPVPPEFHDCPLCGFTHQVEVRP